MFGLQFLMAEQLQKIRALGCEDESLCFAAYRVFIYLQQEKGLIDVRYQYVDDLRTLYLTAKREATALPEIYLPVLSTVDLDLGQLDQIRNTIASSSGDVGDAAVASESLILAICDPSSTVLLYRLTGGIKSINSKLPSRGQLLRQRQLQKPPKVGLKAAPNNS
ncbi:uncharacterized protein LOC125955152 [Anopheles darlingi]|uniref:uncharacterized protein LOC125955152 n=1 Tax=Anopheles darlingi TaxID=43151 RepID=UPI0021004AD3|nr:uncharacterized protein LOC125955152 [Anopheles darlingi]XP_049542058.1 uncharacterized protein LOC125955152 [Anopheles darlingi]